MDQESTEGAAASFAAQAFTELRGEVGLLRRAIEQLTAERTSMPDYEPTLEAIGKRLEDICVWARKVAGQPGVKLTPEVIAQQITAAARSSREHDQQMLDRATYNMNAASDRFDAAIATTRSVHAQNRELKKNRIAFAVAGMMTFAILPGAVARSMPVSWAMPERIAARMLGLDMWHAGQDMMAKADPDRWEAILHREHERAERAAARASPEKR
ncbi:DUF6118 family protein [Stakelama saccharophila]|uniref:DUF6118 family protein n=1 Tax=Stakelama saccharophila TaxID=3075605 RepID=A0ABZ0B8B1_9SPHN|nr:DUF6118 family protein [Stakelama sp. W311]WNO53623.1 DUF6118 family protein [Stakelama sp. W311]